MQKEFTSERLLLNELNITDVDFIFELVNTKEWIKFIGDRNVKTNEDAVAYMQRLINNSNITYWVVKLKDQQTAVGVVTLIKRDYLDHHDIGFAFLPQHAGKGYAYEAASIVLSSLVKNGNHTAILATTLEENVNSIKLLEKLGLSFSKKFMNDGEELFLYTATIDKLQIDFLTKNFFSIFTNTNNRQPDWAMLHTVCIPETIIIKKTGTEEIIYNLNSFTEPRKKILADGTLIDFKENEIEGATTIISNIAQRSSRYQKNGYLNGKYFKEYGNKFFQFIKTNNGWKINAMIWEDDIIQS